MKMQIERKVHYWTQEEDNYIKENYLNMTDKEMSDNLPNRSEKSVKMRRNKFQLIRPYSRTKNSKGTNKDKPSYEYVKKEFENRKYILLSDESEYKFKTSKLRYKCIKHEDKGELSITYSHFSEGKGCPFCGRERTSEKRTEKFNNESQSFDRQLCNIKNLEYIDTKRINGIIHIYFICPNHRKLGVQHMARYNMNRKDSNGKGCKYCNGKDIPNWYIKQEIENKYPNYEVISEYLGMNKPLTCFCKKHKKEFTHDAKYIFHEGQGCELCAYDKKFELYRLSDEEIINRVQNATPDLEIVDISSYKGYNEPLNVRCKKCGFIWTSTFASLVANKPLCPNCSEDMSKGEQKILNYCKYNNLNYSIQYAIPECKYKKPLKFDMAIFNSDDELLGLIEYQGEQHYSPIEHFGGKERFEINQLRDSIKREYCIKNNIPLLEIPYWEYNNVDLILEEFIEKIA